MNFKVKLFAIFCVVITVIACQKEEITPANSPAYDQTVSEVFTDGGPLGGTAGEPQWEPSLSNDDDRITNWTTYQPTWPTGPELEATLDEDVREVEGFQAWPNDWVEPNISSDSWKEVTIEWSDTPPTGDQWIMAESIAEGRRALAVPRPGTDPCLYEDCETAIPAAIEHYQALANQLCQDLYFCVPCCSGGSLLYAMVMVQHDCGIISDPSKY